MCKNSELARKLIIAALCLYWCEVCKVNCVDVLDFWVRDAEIDPRRANEHRSKSVAANQPKFRYNRSRSVDKYTRSVREGLETKHKDRHNRGRDDNSVLDIERSRDREKRNRGRENNQHRGRDDDQKRDRGSNGDQNWARGREQSRSQLRHGRESESGKWPKIQRHRTNDKSRRDLPQSTRMTPMYLMQQPPKSAENKSAERDVQPELLSAYSISKQMRRMMSKFPGVNVTHEIIGRTVSYNDIVLLKITEDKSDTEKYFRADESKYIDEVPEKKIIFIVHGLSVMGMTKISCLNSETAFLKLVSYYLAHLDKFDIFFMPLANPDGYAFLPMAMLWNKNMSPQSACPGVALDRNFDVAWNMSRVISSCSQLYPGPSPFSEPETRAVREVFHRHSHKIIAYLHVHGGTFDVDAFKGEAVLYPRGFSENQSDDDKYLDLRGEIDEAMKNASFQVMSVTVDTLYNWYGKVAGTSVDYAAGIYGIPYAMELVMQSYENYRFAEESEEFVTNNALTEIWRRLIEVTFNNIWKNTHTNDIMI